MKQRKRYHHDYYEKHKNIYKKECPVCGKIMGKSSKKCSICYHKSRIGKKRSIEECKKISLAKLGNKNPQWKGDRVGYASLHEWVGLRLKKPEKCQECQEKPPYDLANKGVYDRNLNNWEWLCRKCHMIKDGRMLKFINLHKQKVSQK